MTPVNTNKALSERNSFASIRARRPWSVIRGQTWLAGILILLLFPNAFAQTDFSAFWKKFMSAVIAGDKATVAEMMKFPLSMPAFQKAVKNRPDFCSVIIEILMARPTPPNVLRAPNHEKSPPVGVRFTALLRKLQRTGETHRFASSLN